MLIHGGIFMCSVENCDKKATKSGMCNMHYLRVRKHGNPQAGIKNHAPIEERFWRFIVKNESCWSWTGNKALGYGRISTGKKPYVLILAHRLSWEIHNKQKIPDGMFVMHKCDNPECCNPEHLIIGTPKENTQDMIAKGRKRVVISSGNKNGKSVLNEEKVRFIRASDLPHAQLAKLLEVSPSCVRGVRIGRTWSHIK
jgi:hypothetical protein